MSFFDIMKSKGVVDDMTGALLNSNEESERPERVLGASRPWLDPRINMLVCESAFFLSSLCYYFSLLLYLNVVVCVAE